MSKPKTYEFKFERQFAAQVLQNFRSNLEAGQKRVYLDPIKSHVHLLCPLEKCKGRATIQQKTWHSLLNPPSDQAFEVIGEILKQHGHFAPELKMNNEVGFFNLPVSGAFVTFCQSCLEYAPITYSNTSMWRHKCPEKIWCLPNPQKKPSMRFNTQGQLWVLDTPFHNLVADFLFSLPEGHAKRDQTHHVWLISDSISDQVAGYVTPLLAEYGFTYEKDAKKRFEERQKKFAALANKASEHHIAAFEFFKMLSPNTIGKIKRIAFASLHPHLLYVDPY